MGIKGYKVFNSDWTCRGFQYEVGKTYKHEGNIKMCKHGFHFCQKAASCFNYYEFDSKNKVAEVEAVGLVETQGNKSVTDEIIIIREISWQELLTIVNTGDKCTGLSNSGNYNSGNFNSGSFNSGTRNSGDSNSGDGNTGIWNSGNNNSGNLNFGNWNSGNYNSGNNNSGNWNSGNWNSGYFNSTTPKVTSFNKPTNLTHEEFRQLKGVQVLDMYFTNTLCVFSDEMTDEEKKDHPEHETTGGYLKTVDFKTVCKLMWERLNEDEKQAVKEIPNFDAEVFKEITGIDVEEE